MPESIGEILKSLRNARSERPKTQSEMADFLGLGLRQYQRYEEGTTPDLDKLLQLMELFNYDFISHITNGKFTLIKTADMNAKQEVDWQSRYFALLEKHMGLLEKCRAEDNTIVNMQSTIADNRTAIHVVQKQLQQVQQALSKMIASTGTDTTEGGAEGRNPKKGKQTNEGT